MVKDPTILFRFYSLVRSPLAGLTEVPSLLEECNTPEHVSDAFEACRGLCKARGTLLLCGDEVGVGFPLCGPKETSIQGCTCEVDNVKGLLRLELTSGTFGDYEEASGLVEKGLESVVSQKTARTKFIEALNEKCGLRTNFDDATKQQLHQGDVDEARQEVQAEERVRGVV